MKDEKEEKGTEYCLDPEKSPSDTLEAILFEVVYIKDIMARGRVPLAEVRVKKLVTYMKSYILAMRDRDKRDTKDNSERLAPDTLRTRLLRMLHLR